MLGLGMQAWELLQLVAAGAGRDARDTRGPVRAMAGPATGAQLAMRALLLRAVTIRASLLRGQADVRFMATAADLVPFGRALLLGSVTATASDCLLSGMRLVTTDAAGVAGFDQPRFTLVALATADFVRLRLVRQALVATRARLVPFIE